MSASKRARDAAEIIHSVYSWGNSSPGRNENHLRLSELAKKIGRPPQMIRYWMRHKKRELLQKQAEQRKAQYEANREETPVVIGAKPAPQ
jgi:transposase-like protein